jgi:hypothetical protein
MKFELRLNVMKIDRIHTNSCFNKLFMVLDSNFRGLWWSQFKLWRLNSNFRGQKYKISNFIGYIIFLEAKNILNYRILEVFLGEKTKDKNYRGFRIIEV